MTNIHRWLGRVGIVLSCFGVPALPAAAGEQAERAIAAVNKMVATGEVSRDAALKVAFKQGNINALLGPNLEIQKDWERLTGIVISARVVPQQPALANLRNNPDVDLTVARGNEYPDLVHHGVAEDLGPLFEQYGFTMPGKPPTGFIRPALQSRLGARIVAIPADGDLAILYLRRDLLEDPKERADFRKATGHDLKPPTTWKEYHELARFFHRPDKGLYGTVEQRDAGTAWMFWMQRYLTQAAPYRPLFDDHMHPLINSPEGIAATENYVALSRYGAPGMLEDGKDYSYTMPIFVQGKAFSTIWTIAAAKLFNSANSLVRGKFIAAPLPGTRVGSTLVRRNMLIYGNNLVVASQSKQRRLAFLFAMWLTDPDISTRTVGVAGGFTDPYRWHHLKDARIVDLYTDQALKVSAGEWTVAISPGTGLPGDGDYLEALGRAVVAAARGEVSAATAMQRAATDWERITEHYGRERQAQAWGEFRKSLLLHEPGFEQP